MIRYSLHCERGHAFESWFHSSSAYESQEKRKLVTCPACGSAKVERAIMAPQIVSKKGRDITAAAPAAATEVTATSSTPLMMAQERELRAKLKELRDHIVKNADNVGERFPNEARKMHYGDIEHRPNARPMTGSAKQSIEQQRKCGLLRRFAPRNDGFRTRSTAPRRSRSARCRRVHAPTAAA
jgi:hypothetical protein